MEIQQVIEVGDELVAAFGRLMPQLGDATPPTFEELMEIVDAGGILLVAKDPGIIGVLTLTIYRVPTGKKARIDDVIVDTPARKHGVGEALMREAIERARDAEAQAIHLTSHPRREAANRLYQRLGFERGDTNVYAYKLR